MRTSCDISGNFRRWRGGDFGCFSCGFHAAEGTKVGIFLGGAVVFRSGDRAFFGRNVNRPYGVSVNIARTHCNKLQFNGRQAAQGSLV